MVLYIDTSNSDEITIGIDGKKYKRDARNEKAQALLPFIDELMKKGGLDFSDISEIEINPGPGSFTGLRVGTAIAQAIGWILEIPINGKFIGEDSVEITY